MLKRQTEQFPAAPQSRFSHAWRALRHRNFRLFFTGQSISLIGTWTTRVATSWLVYRLTRSALLLGTVSFAGQIATCLLAPFAGVTARTDLSGVVNQAAPMRQKGSGDDDGVGCAEAVCESSGKETAEGAMPTNAMV